MCILQICTPSVESCEVCNESALLAKELLVRLVLISKRVTLLKLEDSAHESHDWRMTIANIVLSFQEAWLLWWILFSPHSIIKCIYAG